MVQFERFCSQNNVNLKIENQIKKEVKKEELLIEFNEPKIEITIDSKPDPLDIVITVDPVDNEENVLFVQCDSQFESQIKDLLKPQFIAFNDIKSEFQLIFRN